MIDYILISTLNDFIFCPYSIYLHNVYMESDESIFHATPQTQGKLAHTSVDNKRASNKSNVLLSLPVYSQKYGLMGKIDVYKKDEKKLIERKYQLKQIYQGQIYQLWAQMFCLEEMGYDVDSLAFYEISTNRMIPVNKPTEEDILLFEIFIKKYKSYDPGVTTFEINPNKCAHCVYCNLCDKTIEDNVYA